MLNDKHIFLEGEVIPVTVRQTESRQTTTTSTLNRYNNLESIISLDGAVGPKKNGGVAAGFVSQGLHTEGFCLDEGRILNMGPTNRTVPGLKAIIADGTTDGYNTLAPESRRSRADLVAGFYLDRGLDPLVAAIDKAVNGSQSLPLLHRLPLSREDAITTRALLKWLTNDAALNSKSLEGRLALALESCLRPEFSIYDSAVKNIYLHELGVKTKLFRLALDQGVLLIPKEGQALPPGINERRYISFWREQFKAEKFATDAFNATKKYTSDQLVEILAGKREVALSMALTQAFHETSYQIYTAVLQHFASARSPHWGGGLVLAGAIKLPDDQGVAIFSNADSIAMVISDGSIIASTTPRHPFGESGSIFGRERGNKYFPSKIAEHHKIEVRIIPRQVIERSMILVHSDGLSYSPEVGNIYSSAGLHHDSPESLIKALRDASEKLDQDSDRYIKTARSRALFASLTDESEYCPDDKSAIAILGAALY